MQDVSPRRPPRVLVADPNAKIRRAVQTILGGGYECVTCGHASEVLEELTGTVDLVITDVELPGLSGIELCRQMKGDPRLATTPVVLLTAVKNDDSRAVGLESGADEFLFKPIRPRELRARVATLIAYRLATLNLETRSRELETANRTLTELQRELVNAEKRASITTFVAGVAHEINNPLSYIIAGVHSLGELIDTTETLSLDSRSGDQAAVLRVHFEECRAILADVLSGGDRLRRICNDLKQVSIDQSATLELEPVELDDEISRAWRTCNAPAVNFHCTVANQHPFFSVAHLIGQVLINLFRNAVQAMNGEGELWCDVQTSPTEVHISVRDSGPGIPPELLTRIFDPFFTTKSSSQGTGLGLAVSSAAVERLGGRLEAHSEPGQGATFVIRLPRRTSAGKAA